MVALIAGASLARCAMQLIADDPELRVVIREWPIFEGSDEAARMALAAARNRANSKQFHFAMFGLGQSFSPIPPNQAGSGLRKRLDIEQAQAEAFHLQRLSRNIELIRKYNVWRVGSVLVERQAGLRRRCQVFEGAVAPRERLPKAA